MATKWHKSEMLLGKLSAKTHHTRERLMVTKQILTCAKYVYC